MHRIPLILFLSASLAACAPAAGAPATESLPTPVTITPASPETGIPSPTMSPMPTETPPDPEPTETPADPTPTKGPPEPDYLTGPTATGPQEAAPRQLMDEVISDLAARLSVSAAQITVASSEAVVWRDGSLGCSQPGMAYTQALVPGYRIILAASGQNYDYHTSETHFFLCEG